MRPHESYSILKRESCTPSGHVGAEGTHESRPRGGVSVQILSGTANWLRDEEQASAAPSSTDQKDL
jgi:hypothetical protein